LARIVRNAKLDSRSARTTLPQRDQPYWHRLSRGLSLGYRKAPKGNVWLVKLVKPGFRRQETLGPAEDVLDADGVHVLSFDQAQHKAFAWKAQVETAVDQPLTVREGIDRYEKDMKARRGDIGNIDRLRAHLTNDLVGKPLAALTVTDLRKWRDGLTRVPSRKRKTPIKLATSYATLSPDTINRTCTVLKAVLNHAADDPEHRIMTRQAWELGLKSLPSTGRARNVVLGDRVFEIMAESYKIGFEFGLFIELNTVSGARADQIRRLNVDDLQADRLEPRLMMPPSKKGKKGIEKESLPVPISPDLARRLKAATAGRPPGAPLLTNPEGQRWQKPEHDDLFKQVVKRCGLADWKGLGYPATVRINALRHSAIVRQIEAHVPLRIVAATHDTSVRMIEKHYSKYILDHTDAISRAALLDTSRIFGGDNVVSPFPSRTSVR
jgi:hypothetical protein